MLYIFYPVAIDRSNYPGNIASRSVVRSARLWQACTATHGDIMETLRTFTAFAGHRCIAGGDIQTTLTAAKREIDAGESELVLVFEDQTGAQLDFDWRGTTEDVLARLPQHPMFSEPPSDEKARTGPGRPKLGVICREVSLLPRHWQWLEAQSGGISAALRRLVDEARKAQPAKEEACRMRDAISRFMWAMAGNLPGFEEVSRALFANDAEQFHHRIQNWPKDIREHLTRLSAIAFSGHDASSK
jgi:uncharacterized protein